MSILQAMKEYLSDCPFLDEMARDDIHVELLSESPTNYGLSAAGDMLIKRYVDGRQVRQANFILYAKEYTFDDVQRLENSGFCEEFTFWLEDKNTAGELPDLGENITAEKVSASNGMMFEIAENSDTGTYYIQINLIYRR